LKSVETKPKILIIEDEVENQKYLQLVLRNEFETEVCDSAKSFLEKIRTNKFDAVLMDISLKGGESGIDLLKQLKKSSLNKNIPAVCLSAHLYGEELVNTKLAGIDAYLMKPVNSKILIKTLKDQIEEKILS
jgi:CheY-like chemotaxis protein